VDNAKLELQEVVDFLKNPDKYTALGAKIPKARRLVNLTSLFHACLDLACRFDSPAREEVWLGRRPLCTLGGLLNVHLIAWPSPCMLRAAQLRLLSGAPRTQGCLLVGPPGTGKTLLGAPCTVRV